MEEYWKKVWMDAVAGMRALLDGYMAVEDSLDGMRKDLAYVMKHGCGAEKAEAIGHFGDYKWAVHETEAHTGGLLPVNIPRPVTDKLFRFLETGTVE